MLVTGAFLRGEEAQGPGFSLRALRRPLGRQEVSRLPNDLQIKMGVSACVCMCVRHVFLCVLMLACESQCQSWEVFEGRVGWVEHWVRLHRWEGDG